MRTVTGVTVPSPVDEICADSNKLQDDFSSEKTRTCDSIIGVKMDPEKIVDRGEFFLKGYDLSRQCDFIFNGHNIVILPNGQNLEESDRLKRRMSETSETATMTIVRSCSQGELRNLAVDIKNLLSIALGRRIIFDRQRYWLNDDYEDVEHRMSSNENQGEQIIPDFELKNFLASTLPNWTNLSKAEKDDIFVITDYLNQTRHDFIEDRVLRTVQAWECSAFCWTPEIELSSELKDLRNRIKQVYKEWKGQTNFQDHNGELGKRLTLSLDQEKLVSRLDRLIAQSGLSIDRIDLDLKTLKNLRDQVAHTGRIKIKGDEAIKFLQPGIKGLQLILLDRLGYTGKVNGDDNGWCTIDDIGVYFHKS